MLDNMTALISCFGDVIIQKIVILKFMMMC